MENRPLISVISPEYKGEKMVSELVRRNIAALSSITENFEIILVNDASPDNSWEAIKAECAKDKRVKGLNLSRNFGQHYAISAGCAYASGEWVVVMDCDLQDAPEEIPRLYAKALEGWDIVQARRINKQFGWWKKFTSKMFHRTLNWLSGARTDAAACNFGIYSHQVIKELNNIKEYSRSFGSLVRYLGFKACFFDVKHNRRAEGKSSYTVSKLFKLATDVIIANTNRPLKASVMLGFCMAIVSFLLALYNVLAHFLGIITLQGYTTTVFSIWFVGGLLMTMLGIMGLYIGKIFDQVKGRQIYIVKDKVNFQE